MKYTIYGKPNCPQCEKAKALLSGKQLETDYQDVTKNPELREMLLNLGARSVPQIFLNEKHLGGYEELLVHLQD